MVFREVLHPIELEFVLVVEERGKPEYPEENLSEQRKNQQQTWPTYGPRSESNPGYVDGRRVVSTLRQPCSRVPGWHIAGCTKSGCCTADTAPASTRGGSSSWSDIYACYFFTYLNFSVFLRSPRVVMTLRRFLD